MKLLSRLWLNFSHLNEHKFRHNLKDALSPTCDCGSEIETKDRFLASPVFHRSYKHKDTVDKEILLNLLIIQRFYLLGFARE